MVAQSNDRWTNYPLSNALQKVDNLKKSLTDPCSLIEEKSRKQIAIDALESSKALFSIINADELITDNFTDDQIWRQLELMASSSDLKAELKATNLKDAQSLPTFSFLRPDAEQNIQEEPKKEDKKLRKRLRKEITKLEDELENDIKMFEEEMEEDDKKQNKKKKKLKKENIKDKDFFDVNELSKFLDDNENPEYESDDDLYVENDNMDNSKIMFDDFFGDGTNNEDGDEDDGNGIENMKKKKKKKIVVAMDSDDDEEMKPTPASSSTAPAPTLSSADALKESKKKELAALLAKHRKEEAAEDSEEDEEEEDEDDEEEDEEDDGDATDPHLQRLLARQKAAEEAEDDDSDEDEDESDDENDTKKKATDPEVERLLARQKAAEAAEDDDSDEDEDMEDYDDDSDAETGGLHDVTPLDELSDDERMLEESLLRFQKAYMGPKIKKNVPIMDDFDENDLESDEEEEDEDEDVTDEDLAAQEAEIEAKLKKMQKKSKKKIDTDENEAENDDEDMEEDENDEEENNEEDKKENVLEKLRNEDKRLKAMEEEIRKMEEEQVSDKHWTMKGEAKALDRPLNSLLETHLDLPMSCFASKRAVDQAIALGHTIEEDPFDKTETVSFDIEGIIKQRIADKTFDDVLRIAKVKKNVEKELDDDQILDFNKSRVGLADIYALQYEKEVFGEATAAEEKVSREKEILKRVFAKTMYKLDQLTNSHFTPRPPMIVKGAKLGVASVKVEEAIPLLVAESQQKAPEERFAPLKQTINEADMRPEDKQAHRRLRKDQRRKKDKAKVREGELSTDEWKARKEALDKKNKKAKELKESKGKPKEVRKKIKSSELLAQAGKKTLNDLSHKEAMREFRKKENNFKPAKSFKM